MLGLYVIEFLFLGCFLRMVLNCEKFMFVFCEGRGFEFDYDLARRF